MKLYIWYRKHRTTINSVLFTIVSSVILNIITEIQENVFDHFWLIINQILNYKTVGGFVMWTSVFLLIVSNTLFILVSHRLNKRVFQNRFYSLMKRYTSEDISESIGVGCISWGEGKTVLVCNEIMNGWKAENVIINSFDDSKYCFYQPEEFTKKYGNKKYYFNDHDYQEFIKSENFKKVVKLGNNLPRIMLKKAFTNFNKNDRKLLVDLALTEWSQTSYVWDGFGKHEGTEIHGNELMKEYSKGIANNSEAEPYLPNSLCLHLIIETNDDKIVLSRISQAKINDNPGTWAATLGEQLEKSDITDGNCLKDNFLDIWVKRAFTEEYKFDDINYETIVDPDSIRILSVDFESDRYNFAFCTVVKLRYDFNSFEAIVLNKLAADEAIEIKAINIDQIPDILLDYADEEKRKQYHPSTFLRLLMFFLYKNGYGRVENKLLDRIKLRKQSHCKVSLIK